MWDSWNHSRNTPIAEVQQAVTGEVGGGRGGFLLRTLFAGFSLSFSKIF